MAILSPLSRVLPGWCCLLSGVTQTLIPKRSESLVALPYDVSKENENLKPETQRALQKSVTGNTKQMSRDPRGSSSPSDYQINHDPYDVEKNKHPEKNQKPENHQKLLTGALSSRFLDGRATVHCSSVPTGDQSLSYIYGLPRRKLRDWSWEQMANRGSDKSEVNYEELLCFLKLAASHDSLESKRVVDSTPSKAEGGNRHSKGLSPTPPSSTGHQNSNSQSEVNKSLLETLKMALRTTNGNLSLENLNLSLQKEDHSFLGYLPPPKVRLICGKHGLCVTLSLLETLLNHQDLAHQNKIKWQNFVELLSKASSTLSSDLPTGKKGKETSVAPVQAEVPAMSQGKTEHMKSPEEELQPENLPAETSAPQDPLGSLTIRPVSQPFASPTMNNNKSAECEMWIDRFRKLENVLYLCDLNNTGVLEKERAQHLIHNYNLIYNLSLSPWKIDQALRRFSLEENMLLEPALRYLKEL
ncbi:LOW QUALITY PROTEIN: uncharacterized protein C1orf87 homolog [Artibeus jamaicensis]|uniref:LOW QUALITY PROTEIN: uncharacterized protein C1orf87 homolog n=1 Tax=Artibeus jamaicensis TaxID=9417 RepID=UPI00235A6920|nr:LOW QUALITY PROTEIN: uncharacterized protein C1orf87 homolog [Artibeus jamaicensis]